MSGVRGLALLPFVLACSRSEIAADQDAGTVDEDAGCLFYGCNGVTFCALGEMCPAGDSLPGDAGGGNVCWCSDSGAYRVPGSALGFSCTANAATCK